MVSHRDIEYNFPKAQLAVFFFALLLAVDSINPVKIFLHVFPQVHPWHIATASIILMVYVFISEMKQLLYYWVKIFFNSILSIFRSGDNRFTKYSTIRTCDFYEQKSWKRRIVGDLAWAMGAVPVRRAQDSAKKGSGLMILGKDDNNNSDKFDLNVIQGPIILVSGINTKFTSEIHVQDKIRVSGSAIAMKVMMIENDVLMKVDGSRLPPNFIISEKPVPFDVLAKVDQSLVYDMVLDRLVSNGAIGIFPEGGSHDRTDLLPLKPGVAFIAYSALERDHFNIPIVPVGLNYFRGHRFRGRVIVEYGRPTFIDPKTMASYNKGGSEKRKVCSEFLDRVQDNMRGVIVSTDSYETLQLIHTARRLYRSNTKDLSEKQDLSRRFAQGYKRLLVMTHGNPPQQWLELQNRLKEYQRELNDLGIRDYQVHSLASEQKGTDGDTVLRGMRIPFRIAEIMLCLLLALIPALFLNLPVGLIAGIYSNAKRKKALAASNVKVKGMDVMLSEKVILCIALVPSLWMTYAILLVSLTDLEGPTIALVVMSLPLFSYLGIVTAEAGMVDLKHIKPYLMRLFPSSRRRLKVLPSKRMKLQTDLRELIREIGPSLGNLYTEKKLDWAAIQTSFRNNLKPTKKEE